MPAARWVRRQAAAVAGATATLEAARAPVQLQGAAPPLGPLLEGLAVAAPAAELVPGFVHLRGVLPLPVQQALLDVACDVAQGSQPEGASGGWYRREQGGAARLNDGSKARFWDSSERFPPEFRRLGEELARLAARASPEQLSRPAAEFEARVGALNFYTGRGKMNWHKDDYNFAKRQRPIVMASLGDAADFGYKLRASDADRSVRLESGDVIVFGGDARDIVHAVLGVHPGSGPKELEFPSQPGPGRVSVTWRDVGPEDGLTFNSDERLGLVVTENTLPRYRVPGKGAGKGKGKGRGSGKGWW